MAIKTTVSTQWESAPISEDNDGVRVRLGHDGSYDIYCRDEIMIDIERADLVLLHEAISAALKE